MKKKYATSVLTDIRNFSGLFEKYQYNDSEDFLEFIENYYKSQQDIAKIISDDIHLGTTGDGILAIFKSDEHYKQGYAYALATYKSLNKICEDFSEKTGDNVSFGLGADCGHVWNIGSKKTNLNTYVGTSINRAARIEANTKLFANTKVSIGGYLYNKLIEDLYPSVYSIMEENDGKYDALLNSYPEVVMISKELMLFYIFEMELKNIEKPLPIFRLSEFMADDADNYWKVMSKLLDEKKVNKLKKLI